MFTDKQLLELFYKAHEDVCTSDMWECLNGDEISYIREVFKEEHNMIITGIVAQQCFDAICSDYDEDGYIQWVYFNIK